MVASLVFGERTVAIGGGVAPCSALEDVVEGEGDEAAVDAEGGSGVRWAGWIPSSDSAEAVCARATRLIAESFWCNWFGVGDLLVSGDDNRLGYGELIAVWALENVGVMDRVLGL